MGITPQKLREHLTQVVRESVTDQAPKRHQNRKLRNHTSDGSTEYDTSEEDPKYTKGRERFWRSIRKQVQANARINVRL